MPINIEHHTHRISVGASGKVGGGHRGEQVGGFAPPGELVDLAADGLHFRGPVHSQHPAQIGRGEPCGTLSARLSGQGTEHALEEHRR